MPFDRFLIAPLRSGLQTDLRPFLVPDDAFERLKNAYVWRGRVTKRPGGRLMATSSSSPIGLTSTLLSRFRVSLGSTDNTGAATGTVPGNQFNVGQQFSIGTQVFTVQTTGTPVTMLNTGSGTGTFNTSTGAYTFSGATPSTQIYYYPALPVLGLTQYQNVQINNQPTYGFDQSFSYVFNNGWNRSKTSTWVPFWHGTNLDYYWTTNWIGAADSSREMFVTNFNYQTTGSTSDDPLWYFDGTNWFLYSYSADTNVNPAATNTQPLTVTQTNTNSSPGTIITNYIQTAKILVVFKNRLLALYTIENNANGATQFDPGSPTTSGITSTNYQTSTNTAFPNRCRFTHLGNPLAPNAWLEPDFSYQPNVGGTVYQADGGSFIDAPTDEAIVSAEFIKDRLIVYFERSTWEIVYTYNQLDPFVWQKINTELGSQSLLSSIPFDTQVITIGQTGVHACNGANVQRIDEKIPQQIFNIRYDNNGPDRIAGIRDYFNEVVYWAFPDNSANANFTYNTQILLYNYVNKTWALLDDSVTVFGYFQLQSTVDSVSWADTLETWEEASYAWRSGESSPQFRAIIAGNQQGYTFILDDGEDRNAPVLSITNLSVSSGITTLTVIDHTIEVDDYILIENAQGVTGLNNAIYQVQSIDPAANTLTIIASPTGNYTGGGSISRVSQIDILTKQFNPYDKQDRNVYIAKVNFAVVPTYAGQIMVDYYPSASEYSMVQNSSTLMGTNVLETSPYATVPFEAVQNRLWHPVYFGSDGECIQLRLYLNDAMMKNISIALADFELDALILYTQPTTYRMQ